MSCNTQNSRFEPVRTGANSILSYLMANNQNIFKLLKHIDPTVNPYSQPDLTFEEKVAMVARSSADTNESVNKNILFMMDTREAFSTNVAQLRIETDIARGTDSYRGYMNVWFQIVVPIASEVMGMTSLTGERRTDAIFVELTKTLDRTDIPNSGFNSPMFINSNAKDGAGRETGTYRKQANTDYTQRMVCFSVLI